ncbi:MAG: BspA family leucine-rich repeat surface protein [Firmicutes bacterium]|nr:BspA family leucine-rich repeat surface protein [Bacillota bacterium]
MKELETLKLYRGATSVIEFDFSEFEFENNGYCQLTIKKKYNDDIIFQHDFEKSIKYYVTFKDEFTSGLDDDKYKYDIMYMLNDERYPQCSISDIIIDKVVNNYVGNFDENAVQVTEILAEGVEITQSIKVTTANVIITDANLQEKNVTPSLEDQIILSEEGFDGLSKVIVEGVNLETKTVSPNTNTQIITPNEALGLSSVTIEPVSLQEGNVIPNKEVQTLNPSDEFVGFSQVIVEKIPDEYVIPEGNLNITKNGDYDVTEKASVNVNVQPNLQNKVENIKAPINTFIHPDEGFDGINYVNVIATVNTEQKTVTPTEEEQILTPSEDTYFDSVTVNPIPEEYIIPTGELEITENGSYDVKEKASVDVNIQPKLGTKTITENGVYNASDDNLDGYSSIEVETSGADLTEYFNETITVDSSGVPAFARTIKKIPALRNTGTSCQSFYKSFIGDEIDLTNFDTSLVTTFYYMYDSCINLTSIIGISNLNTENVEIMEATFQMNQKLTSLDLSGWHTPKLTNTKLMFSMDTKLTHIDMRNFDFTNVTTYTNMFGSNATFGVPNDCLIIVKDDTQKAWINEKFTRLTNVKTVAEYEGA